MNPADADFYREVAHVALSVADKHGFALGGGLAWVTHGLVDRPTQDVDLFADVDGAAGAAAESRPGATTPAQRLLRRFGPPTPARRR